MVHWHLPENIRRQTVNTEKRNPKTTHIDTMSSLEMIKIKLKTIK